VDIDILYLVDRLENLITSSRRMPLVNQIMVKEADVLSIIDQMRTSIPDEFKQAQTIIQDKERILTQAQTEANKLIARAHVEAEEAVHRDGLLRLADEKAEQIQAEADAYVGETLRALRDHLTSIEVDIDRSILSIEKGLASLELPEDEGQEDVYEEVGTVQRNSELPVKTMPRSASLAVDTMGGPIYPQDAKQKNN
jgi:cell division septum initiation protein DivIVA